MVEIIAVLAVLVAIGAAYFYAKKQNAKEPALVEEYKLEETSKDGFRKLILRFEDANRRVSSFELHPAHAHALSDDLLRYTARARKPESATE